MYFCYYYYLYIKFFGTANQWFTQYPVGQKCSTNITYALYITGKVITANYVPVASYSQLFPDSVVAREPILSAVKPPIAAATMPGVGYWKDIFFAVVQERFPFSIDVNIFLVRFSNLFFFVICWCFWFIFKAWNFLHLPIFTKLALAMELRKNFH